MIILDWLQEIQGEEGSNSGAWVRKFPQRTLLPCCKTKSHITQAAGEDEGFKFSVFKQEQLT